ncbi:coproporphyrinogen-III oxidase family protein [Kitasatospora sp. NPDC059827]|uniref:coproporphyrinogen-III oxidase family protein n=1 Tax=Kitasatospora sp. NPDC059827 TaxID=3346964 RepID=UPI00365736F7
MSISTTTTSMPFWKEYPERDNEWVRQYPTKHVAVTEEEVFAREQMGVYVHIPFCNRLCFSCPYIKFQTDRDLTRTFLDALKAEITLYAQRPYVQDHVITLGYIGGGTPTSLTAPQLDELLGHLFGSLNTAPDADFSIETTPVDISERKARVLLDRGVRRISLGVQTFVEEELKSLGRPSDPEMLKNSIRLLRDCGYENINIDLMHGINGQTMESWEYSLDVAIELGVTCVSFYTYMEFAQISTKRRKLPPVPERALVDEMFLFAAEKLTAAGFLGYYGDCFAKPGFQPKYGETSWSEDVPIIPLGPTATGHLREHWYFNEPDIGRYVQTVMEGRLPISMGKHITRSESIRRSMVLGVKAGRVDRERFRRLHGVDFLEMFREEIADLAGKGLVTVREDGIEVTGPKGWYYLDNISKAFYSPEFRRYPQHLGADITGFINPQMRTLPLTVVSGSPQKGDACEHH